MTNSVATIELNSGHSIPQLGFGVFLVDPDDTQRVVEDALEVGYRHIDTATGYNNETQVGAAIRASGIPRDEIFVTTKLLNDDHKSGDVTGAFSRSLDMLGLDYLDLYLIHWPMPRNERFVDTWRSFETFKSEGRARSIGVSNFLVPHLETLLAATDVVPDVNQVELHPLFQQRELREFQATHGIRTEAWGPLGQGKYELFTLPAIADVATAHDAENFDIFGFELSADEMATIDALDENRRVGGHPEDVN
jgi:2,5-diketo-D-gluconate reductase A